MNERDAKLFKKVDRTRLESLYTDGKDFFTNLNEVIRKNFIPFGYTYEEVFAAIVFSEYEKEREAVEAISISKE